MTPTVSKLITLAVHPESPTEEARTAAMLAVKIIHRDGLELKAEEQKPVKVDNLRLGCYAWLAEHSILGMLREAKEEDDNVPFKSILWVTCWVFRLSDDDKPDFEPLLRSTLKDLRRRGLVKARRGRGGGYYLA